MAISDSNYKFIRVNVGAYGSEGDSGIFFGDKVGKKIYNDTLPLPNDTIIDGIKIPFYFIADDAFPLQKRIMKSFVPSQNNPLTEEERIFNYRLSRARRCVENSFGILSRKWLCLSQPLRQLPSRVSKIVLTCCVLHNLLIKNKHYCPIGFADYYNENEELIEGEWRQNRQQLTSLQPLSGRGRASQMAKNLRNHLKDYVNSIGGSVSWQRKCIE